MQDVLKAVFDGSFEASSVITIGGGGFGHPSKIIVLLSVLQKCKD